MCRLALRDVRQGLEALQNQLWLSLDSIRDTAAGDGQEPGGRPYRNTAFRELIERVAPLIERLTPREKLVLSLYYDGSNMRETAQSWASQKVAFHSALTGIEPPA